MAAVLKDWFWSKRYTDMEASYDGKAGRDMTPLVCDEGFPYRFRHYPITITTHTKKKAFFVAAWSDMFRS